MEDDENEQESSSVALVALSLIVGSAFVHAHREAIGSKIAELRTKRKNGSGASGSEDELASGSEDELASGSEDELASGSEEEPALGSEEEPALGSEEEPALGSEPAPASDLVMPALDPHLHSVADVLPKLRSPPLRAAARAAASKLSADPDEQSSKFRNDKDLAKETIQAYTIAREADRLAFTLFTQSIYDAERSVKEERLANVAFMNAKTVVSDKLEQFLATIPMALTSYFVYSTYGTLKHKEIIVKAIAYAALAAMNLANAVFDNLNDSNSVFDEFATFIIEGEGVSDDDFKKADYWFNKTQNLMKAIVHVTEQSDAIFRCMVDACKGSHSAITHPISQLPDENECNTNNKKISIWYKDVRMNTLKTHAVFNDASLLVKNIDERYRAAKGS